MWEKMKRGIVAAAVVYGVLFWVVAIGMVACNALFKWR